MTATATLLQFLGACTVPVFAGIWLLCWLFSFVSRAWLAFWLIVIVVAGLMLLASRTAPREIDFLSPNPDLPTNFK